MNIRNGNPRAKAAAVLLALAALAAPATGATAAAAAAAVPWYRMQQRNDCEAAALRMVLAARGVHAQDQAVLGRIGVDRIHHRFGSSGPLAGDPFRAFVGDPNGSQAAGTGFGVYAQPVAAAARSYGLTVLAAGQGITPARLRAQVAAGHPAIAWVDYLWRRVPTRWYTAYDGRRIPYAGLGEHTVVVTGSSGNRVTVNDPSRGRLSVSAAVFDAAYATYGDMAVIVR